MLRTLVRIVLMSALLTVLVLPRLSDAQERITSTFSYMPDADGSPLLKVVLTPEVTATFLVDTGSSICQISEELVKRLRLKPYPALTGLGKPMLCNGKQVNEVHVTNVPMGDLSLDLPMVLVKRSSLGNGSFDGVIGCNVFQQYAVQFNFPKHQMTMWAYGKLSPQELEQAGMKNAVALPQVFADSGCFYVEAKLNDQKTGRFVIDTGGDVTVISPEVAEQLSLKPTLKPIAGNTFMGKLPFDHVVLHTLGVGPLMFTDLMVAYPHKPIADYPMHIGMDALHQYKILIDLPLNTIYFKPPAD